MSKESTREQWVSVAGWFLAVSYGLGAPYTAFLEYRSQVLSQRFDIPPELVYLTSALQLGCAMVVLVRPLALRSEAQLIVNSGVRQQEGSWICRSTSLSGMSGICSAIR